jgi:ribosomal protein S13
LARIAGVNVPLNKRVEVGLTYVYGIGRPTSNRVLSQLGIDPNTQVRDLSEGEVAQLRDVIDNELTVDFRAVTDRATPVNLTQHSYFNLAGKGDVLSHHLWLDAAHYTPVGPGLIPVGEIAPVAGTDFDFRTARPIRREAGGGQVEYDHNWCLARSRQPLRRVARTAGRSSPTASATGTAVMPRRGVDGFRVAPWGQNVRGKKSDVRCTTSRGHSALTCGPLISDLTRAG